MATMLRTKKRPKHGPGDAPADDTFLPTAGPDDPAAAAVQAALASGLHWIKVNDEAARSGEAEGVHHLRTTTRQLRTALALFSDLTDPAWAGRLAGELKWLAGKLGTVRDLDVLRDRLAADARESDSAEALAPLTAALDDRHGAASRDLQDALQGERYAGLIRTLAESLAAAPLADAAWGPCRSTLPPLADDAWQALKRAGRALKPDDPDDDFHEVRKRAKRARYAAEAVRAALGHGAADDAGRFARRAKNVQDVLGAHQDAVVAAAEIRKAAAAHPDLGPFNFAAGRLLERERRAAADARDRFFDVWPDLDRKKVLRWLKP